MKEPSRQPEETLARFANGPSLLESALAGLTEADLDIALDPESWTIRQIVHHIVDGDDIWKVCIKMALGNSKAVFDLQWYWAIPQTRWAELWGYSRRAIRPSLVLFSANRCHVAQLMQENPRAWERTAWLKTPSGEEQVTVGWVLELQGDHVLGHIADIRKIREAHGQKLL